MLTELSTIKSILGISDSSEDTELTRLINVASSFIENYTNRTFEEQEVTETYSGTGTGELCLKNYPIKSVSSITIDDEEVSSDDYEIHYTSGIIYKYSYWTRVNNTLQYGILINTNTNNPYRNIEVTYTYGYKLPGVEGRDLPYDLEQVVIDLVVQKYKTSNERQDIIHEEIMDVVYKYSGNFALNAQSIATLNKYRKVV